MNKSELRTKTKVAAARNTVAIAPPLEKPTQGDADAKFHKGAEKGAANAEGSKKNALVVKAAPKVEAALQKGGESLKPVKEPVLKRGRSSAKSLGVDSIAGKPSGEAEAEVDEAKNGTVEQPVSKVHKSQRKEALVRASVPPEKSLRDRVTENHMNGKVQGSERKLKSDTRNTEAIPPTSAGRLRSRIKNQITRIRREEALLEAYGGR